MQQMLDALMSRAGPQGSGSGSSGLGGGSGGGGQDGFSTAGQSGVPAYGPDRLQFSASQEVQSTSGGPAGKDGKNPGAGAAPVANRVAPETFREASEANIVPENIPEKYRTAVKRYFTTGDSKPESN